ncbi:MAG: hypothetical protein IKX22_07235 [Prevotella sp.]|nr:hypothetical protein [Prevotella sp.]
MTSIFIDEESETLFDYYEEWKRPQLLRYAQELNYKIQVIKTPCPQINYFYNKKYHPHIVNNPLYGRGDHINVLQIWFIGEKSQPLLSKKVRYKIGVFKICPVTYNSKKTMLYVENTYDGSFFFVETEDKIVYATIYIKKNEEGEPIMWIEFTGQYHEFYILPPEEVRIVREFVNELIDRDPIPRRRVRVEIIRR